ncbi:hypothetical protein [Maledivibacter halophilus]|uniref:DNA alkylation repair enzyme n=1 Tax=Maledivibacter halophilus TaxID=36842 RepID=A0A1T5MQF0_9FIRM|nr:hypothetical protein [Maledivibacter halophilus]SKC90119.1 hypothetical protein SAMN02194393_05116 [Maledivibacter halophilus]
MDKKILIEKIKDKNIDVENFVDKIIKEEYLKKEIIKQLLNNKDIMVYYHCYYIVSKASELRPEIFYQYWDDFAALMNHDNSYHRDIGLTIIANLISVDQDKLFDNILKDYLEHINDKKFMTAQCCIRNLVKIIKERIDLREIIVETLLNIDKKSSYPRKQKELLKYGVLEILDLVYDESNKRDAINTFIERSATSISPKTKKKAIELKRKYI